LAQAVVAATAKGQSFAALGVEFDKH